MCKYHEHSRIFSWNRLTIEFIFGSQTSLSLSGTLHRVNRYTLAFMTYSIAQTLKYSFDLKMIGDISFIFNKIWIHLNLYYAWKSAFRKNYADFPFRPKYMPINRHSLAGKFSFSRQAHNIHIMYKQYTQTVKLSIVSHHIIPSSQVVAWKFTNEKWWIFLIATLDRPFYVQHLNLRSPVELVTTRNENCVEYLPYQ